MRYQSIQQKISDLPVYLFSSLPGYYILILLYFVKSLYGQVVLGGVMNIVTELALIFGVCLIGIGIASLLPFMVPYSVISLLVLTLLLYRKILRPEQIKDAGGFFIRNMGIFFVPAVVGTMEYVETLTNYLVPFLVITLVTTPLVYFIAGWSVQLCLKLRRKKGAAHA
jgi:holin-like protein